MARKRWLATVFTYLMLEVGALLGAPLRPEQIQEITRLLNKTLVTEVAQRDDGGDPPDRPDAKQDELSSDCAEAGTSLGGPVVVYNGPEPWNVATDLGSLIGELDPSAEIYRPQLRYRLVDESAFDAEDLAALNCPVADLFRIEKSGGWSEVRESVHRLRQSLPPAEADFCGRLSRPG